MVRLDLAAARAAVLLRFSTASLGFPGRCRRDGIDTIRIDEVGSAAFVGFVVAPYYEPLARVSVLGLVQVVGGHLWYGSFVELQVEGVQRKPSPSINGWVASSI